MKTKNQPTTRFDDFSMIDKQPIIQNVVSTANLNCILELDKIAMNCRNAEYNPKRFAAVIMRLKEPKTTALVFKSGKIVCTGAKSPEFSATAIRKFARMIQKQGFEVEFRDFKVQNIVCSCDVKFQIHLSKIFQKHQTSCTFEVDVFPGLIYKMADPKMVLLIFTSGKLVLTGAKVKKALPKMLIEHFKKFIQFQNNLKKMIQ